MFYGDIGDEMLAVFVYIRLSRRKISEFIPNISKLFATL